MKYEVLKYLTAHGLPLPEGASLQNAALFGMERRPDYFGDYPCRSSSPGAVCPLDNGVYWIETERCVEVLALCYPVWDGELSEGMSELGRTLEIEGEMGYLYFSQEAACVTLWELLTPDEVRALDNRYAILFIRGAKPIMDLKYDLTKHPAVCHTVDGGGPPYIHHQKKPNTWLSGAALFAPEAGTEKEVPEHEPSEKQ